MPRLLLVDPNGGDLAERAKADALARRGWDVVVLAPERIREGTRLQVAAPPVPDATYDLRLGRLVGKPPNRCVFASGLHSALATRPDVVHVLADENFAMALQVLAAARALCPEALRVAHSWQNILCTWGRHGQPLQALYAFDTGVEAMVFRLAHGIVARNEEALEVLRRRGYRGPLAHVPWGVDVEPLRRRAAALPAPALPELPRPRFGYVGRLVPEKGIDVFLHALAQVSGSAVLVGDGPMRPHLERLARQLGIEARVHFAGAQPRSDVPAWLQTMDALVLPSRETDGWKEQFGRVLVEAMAVGTPCVGSDSGAIPAVIGDAGRVFRMDDARSLADALARVIDERETFSARARERAEQYTWDRFATGTLQFLETLRRTA